MAGTKILMGHGKFEVKTAPDTWLGIGLTRGGGTFIVEREFKEVTADGDLGPVEGRQDIIREVAKLTVNALELFTAANLPKYYPGTALTTGATEDTLTGTKTIASGDYNEYRWIGKTRDGKAVTIEIDNALNLASLEWGLQDKEEVIPVLELTAHYAEGDDPAVPWRVKFAK